jgi:hypothetical protein
MGEMKDVGMDSNTPGRGSQVLLLPLLVVAEGPSSCADRDNNHMDSVDN